MVHRFPLLGSLLPNETFQTNKPSRHRRQIQGIKSRYHFFVHARQTIRTRPQRHHVLLRHQRKKDKKVKEIVFCVDYMYCALTRNSIGLAQNSTMQYVVVLGGWGRIFRPRLLPRKFWNAMRIKFPPNLFAYFLDIKSKSYGSTKRPTLLIREYI